ncbi:protein phosphatase 2C domain-containing protein, partial [Cyanobium sp. FGCU-52]|nr:protein phosphatase 2C domain-containing protein [Cyanobium sp. FGCU52]
RHSAVGSAAACRAARRAVAAALACHDLADPRPWRQQLAAELPREIHRLWLDEVREHWRQTEPEQPFDAVVYGTTLGMVLLTPGWWGCTGLGDWDLVRVEPNGEAALISEEGGLPEQGEATASLCLPEAPALFAPRARLLSLRSDSPAFALVLTTDGLRKSCASDGDHLRLAAHLAGDHDAAALAGLLDRISSEGCGDDVSMAVGWWAPGLDTPAAAPQAPSPAGRTPLPWLAPLLMAALLAAGLGSAALLRGRPDPTGGPPSRTDAAASADTAVRREARRLCLSPALIEPELRSRRSQFERLHQGKLRPQTLLGQADLDPLGALIAWSHQSRGTGRAELQNAGGLPGACPELQRALERLWRSPTASPPTPDRPPSR